MKTQGPRYSKKLKWVAWVLFVLIFMFSVTEVVVRLRDPQGFLWTNYLERFLASLARVEMDFDPTLGWIPRPHQHQDFPWGPHGRKIRVTTTDHGIRMHGLPPPLEARVDGAAVDVVGVGDSYTFGSDVSDSESWPSHLAQITKKNVINAGVPGYGVDQAFLRAEEMIGLFHPRIVILSLIPADINRSEHSVYQRPKPYYRREGANFVLVRPPYTDKFEPFHIDGFRRVAGYSLAVHNIMLHSFPFFWFGDNFPTKKESVSGDEIVCHVMDLISQTQRNTGTKFGIFLQYIKDSPSFQNQMMGPLKVCAEKNGIPVLDFLTTLDAVKQKSLSEYSALFSRHMSSQGNLLAAQKLWDFIQEKFPGPKPKSN